MADTNAEVAHPASVWIDPSSTKFIWYIYSAADENCIEYSPKAKTQSNLAKKVLAAIGEAKIPLDKDDLEYRQAHNKGVDMVATVLRDLFTRMGIEIGEE
jgi:hypothetical protein